MPGPPPKRNARRTNKRPDWQDLPAGGRTGEPPEFPIAGGTKRVLVLWGELWSSPQAVMWERLGWSRVVARYARLLLKAESSSATAALLGEVRQLEDRLGLSPMAMKRLQWEIGSAEVAVSDDGAANVAELADYRDRAG